MGKSFDPIGPAEQMRDAELCNSTPRPIVSMSFQLAIPWRVALPQSPPPLHQPGAIMQQRAAAGNQKPANGQLCLNYLSHPRGQAQRNAARLEIVVFISTFKRLDSLDARSSALGDLAVFTTHILPLPTTAATGPLVSGRIRYSGSDRHLIAPLPMRGDGCHDCRLTGSPWRALDTPCPSATIGVT